MRVPTRNIAGFARDLIDQCSVSLKERTQRGTIFRNYFLAGSADGNPAIFKKTYAYLDDLASYLYSPVDLKFKISPYGRGASPASRAKAIAAQDELNLATKDSGTNQVIEQAVLWSLVKGKTLVKLGWGDAALEPELVQPEVFGVLREDITTLDKQEAFFHRTWLTRGRFWELIENHPNRANLMRKAANWLSENAPTMPDRDRAMTPVLLGGSAFSGTGPYVAAPRGGSPTGNQNQNVAFWLQSPPPTLAPQVQSRLIPLDELWVWDTQRDDWDTIQMVGPDIVIEGELVLRNAFADSIDQESNGRRLRPNKENPLAERHPFKEFCANPVDGWFWGLSEIQNVGLLQETINARVNGINSMLRRQEDPPIKAQGFNGSVAYIRSRLSKPGGVLVDTNPNAKIEAMPPVIPEGIYESLHESERQFNVMGGMPDIMRGESGPSVRSHKQVQSLTRNASPRFKDRALLIEDQTAAVGSLGLKVLRAKLTRAIVGWMKPGSKSVELAPLSDPTMEPPFEGAQGIEFLMNQIPDDWRVTVNSHSSSPAFMYEEEQKAELLAQRGAISNEALIETLQPANAEELEIDAEAAAVQKAKMLREHPELIALPGGKKKH